MRLQNYLLVCAVLGCLAFGSPVVALESVTLRNGDVLHGELIEKKGDTLIFQHPQLGRLTIDLAKTGVPDREAGETETIAGSSGQLPESPEAKAEEERLRTEEGAFDGLLKPKPGLFGTRFLRGWKNTFGVGLTGSEGGFEDTKLSLAFRTEIEDRKRSWDFDSAYFLNLSPQARDQGSQITKDQAFAQLRRRWYFPDTQLWTRFFAVARTRYDFDQFQPWKHRIAASAGPGLFLLRTERWQLPINVGLGFSSTFGRVNRTAPEATFGVDFDWRLTSWAKLRNSNQFFWNLLRTEEFRTVQSIGINFEPEKFAGVGFGVSFLYRFDTESRGRENDLTYVSSLTYGF